MSGFVMKLKFYYALSNHLFYGDEVSKRFCFLESPYYLSGGGLIYLLTPLSFLDLA